MVLTSAERCAKYLTENQEKCKLVASMQQFKRTKKLASGTPEAKKMIDSSLLNCYIRQNDIRKVISNKKEKAKKKC